MVRILTNALLRLRAQSQPLISSSSSALRRFSTKAGARVIEIDLGTSSSSSYSDVEMATMKKMEELIHSIIVQRSTPDWLPFRPGSSFWVPPGKTRPENLDELVSKLRTRPLSDEEELSIISSRGWPSSSDFIQQDGSSPPEELEVTVEVRVLPSSGDASPDDE